uniref:Uncharacterized protein n=1 Tax=Anguilla anguilla TaxID=7936 RepID=A0A0E9TXH2_ANGAN
MLPSPLFSTFPVNAVFCPRMPELPSFQS